jgi:hypothetical protein
VVLLHKATNSNRHPEALGAHLCAPSLEGVTAPIRAASFEARAQSVAGLVIVTLARGHLRMTARDRATAEICDAVQLAGGPGSSATTGLPRAEAWGFPENPLTLVRRSSAGHQCDGLTGPCAGCARGLRRGPAISGPCSATAPSYVHLPPLVPSEGSRLPVFGIPRWSCRIQSR